jgi:GNAT superfamily N-acetyltransferase
MNEVLLRKATRADIQFITSGWLKSFRNAPFVRGVPNGVYYYYHHKILEELLPRAQVMVACSEADHNQLLGFICAEKMDGDVLIVHYVYVKQLLRKQGIARFMLDTLRSELGTTSTQYTAKTYAAIDLEDKLKADGMVYNPYILYTKLPDGWDAPTPA